MKPNSNPLTHGFARVDLLSSVTCFGLLALMLVASGSATRTATEAVGCHNNHRHIASAWLTHAHDNIFLLGSSYAVGPFGWGNGVGWETNAVYTNVASVLTPSFRPYVGEDPAVFRCPSDRFVSPAQRKLGWRHRVRTYSINAQVGTARSDWGGSFPTYQRLQDFSAPAATFVFAEEHPGSINDSSFATDPTGARSPKSARLIDIPASFHNRGAHFGFADGHVELHRWTGSRVVQPVVAGRYVNLIIPAPNDPDAVWLGQHASQLR